MDPPRAQAIVSWPAGDEEGFSVSYTWHRKRPAFHSMSLAQLKEGGGRFRV